MLTIKIRIERTVSLKMEVVKGKGIGSVKTAVVSH